MVLGGFYMNFPVVSVCQKIPFQAWSFKISAAWQLKHDLLLRNLFYSNISLKNRTLPVLGLSIFSESGGWPQLPEAMRNSSTHFNPSTKNERIFTVSMFEQVWCFQLSTSQGDDARYEEHQLFRGCHMILPQGVYIALARKAHRFLLLTGVYVDQRIGKDFPPPHFREKKRQRAQKPPFGNCKLDGTIWFDALKRSMEHWNWVFQGSLKINSRIQAELQPDIHGYGDHPLIDGPFLSRSRFFAIDMLSQRTSHI